MLLNFSFVDKEIGIGEAFNFDFAGFDKYAVIERISYGYDVCLFNNFADSLKHIKLSPFLV